MARQNRSSGTTDIELFLDMLAAERGAGPNTLTAYTRDLEDFSDYLVTKKRTIVDATTDHVRGYLRHLAKRMVEGQIGLRIARAPHAFGVKFDKGRGQGFRAVLAFC